MDILKDQRCSFLLFVVLTLSVLNYIQYVHGEVIYKESLGDNIDNERPKVKLVDENFDPEDMGHVNLQSLKPGQCPEIACPEIKGKKPCSHAKPIRTVFDWQGMECTGCPKRWNPRSCDEKPPKMDKTAKKKLKDIECPKLQCPEIKAKKPCPEALPHINRVIWKGKVCSGCPVKWNEKSCTENQGYKTEL